MTQTSVPKPSHGAQPQTETVTTVMHLALGRRYYEAQCFDGGEISTITAAKIVNRAGQQLVPVWDTDWTELEPGLKTKANAIEIHSFACPVCISFTQERLGRVYNRRTYEDDHHTATDIYEICYQSGD